MYRFSSSVLVPRTRDGLQPLHLDEFSRWLWADRSLSIISMIHCSCGTSCLVSSAATLLEPPSSVSWTQMGSRILHQVKQYPNKDAGEVGLRWLDAGSECMVLTSDCSVGWPLSPPCL